MRAHVPSTGLVKYAKLHWAFFRASFAADIEYRMNFFVRIITDVMWYCAQVLTFEVIFTQTPLLGSWDVHKTRIFLGLLFMVDAVYMIFVQENIDHMSQNVRKGELDLLLVKPVNSQFMVSCRRVATAFIVNFMLAVGWFVWALSTYPEPLPLIRILWLILLMPVGFLVFYSLRFLFSAVTVITVRAENLQYLWYQLYRLGMRPDTIYSPWMKYVVLTMVPVAFVASVPARALLEPPSYGLFAWAVVMGAICFFGTARFWKYALRHYSSASS